MAKDLCVICGRETPYEFDVHIDKRYGYIEGAGQLCNFCYIYSSDKFDKMDKEQLNQSQKEQLSVLQSKLFMARSNNEIETTMKEIIKLIPNNYDLGTYIRSLFNQNQPLEN
jgi:hypothetical protein